MCRVKMNCSIWGILYASTASALLVATKSSLGRVREALDATAAKFGVTFVETDFQGECSRDEIARLGELARKRTCHCTVGLGGGKALDTARCVAAGQGLIIGSHHCGHRRAHKPFGRDLQTNGGKWKTTPISRAIPMWC